MSDNGHGCQCYVIGGPFIAEDPECPFHGFEATQRRFADEDRIVTLEGRIDSLERQLQEALDTIQRTLAVVQQIHAKLN